MASQVATRSKSNELPLYFEKYYDSKLDLILSEIQKIKQDIDKLDSRVDKLDSRIDRQESKTDTWFRWIIGMMFTVLLTNIGILFKLAWK